MVVEHLSPMLSWFLHQLHWWGIQVVFLFAFLETAAFLGLVVPGEVAVILAGALASRGVLHLADVIWVAALGAICGDQVSYLLGRRFGRDWVVQHGRRFGIRAEHIAWTEAFFERYGGKAVFFGRFIGWLRPLTPLVAGVGHMAYPRFLFFDVYGASLWAMLAALIGYLAGSSWQTVKGYLSEAGLAVGSALLLMLTAYWLVARRRRMLGSKLDWMDRTLAQRVPRSWSFLKARFRKSRRYGLRLTVGLTAVAAALAVFLETALGVIAGGSFIEADLRVRQFFEGFRTSELTPWMARAAHPGQGYLLIIAAGVIGGYLLRRGLWKKAMTLVLAAGGGEGLLLLFRLVFHSANPGGIAGPPSEGAFSALLVCGFGVYIVWTEIESEVLRFVLYSLAVLVVLLAGFSRLYVEACWLSDVLAGYAAAAAWLTVVLLLGGVPGPHRNLR